MSDRARLGGVFIGVLLVLLYFPAGNNNLFPVLGVIIIVLAMVTGTNVRSVKGPGFQIEYFQAVARQLRRNISVEATDSVTITDSVEAVVVHAGTATATAAAHDPSVETSSGQALAQLAANIEQHPPESPEQLADQMAKAVRERPTSILWFENQDDVNWMHAVSAAVMDQEGTYDPLSAASLARLLDAIRQQGYPDADMVYQPGPGLPRFVIRRDNTEPAD